MGEAMRNAQSARTCHSPFEGFSAQRLLKSNRVEVQLCRKKEQRNESSKGRPSSLIHPINDLQSPDRLRKEHRTQESDAERRTKESTRRWKSHCASHSSTPPLRAGRPRTHLASSQIFRIPARSASAAAAAAASLPCLVLWHCKTTYSNVFLETWSLDSLQDFESVNKLSLVDDIQYIHTVHTFKLII